MPTQVFVARESELGFLMEALQRARAGQGQVLFVTGQAMEPVVIFFPVLANHAH